MSAPTIAYLSMEIALDPAIPTYAGGLGVLAGDTVRSAADLGVRMLGVTLLHRRGYFSQRLDPDGRQTEEPAGWEVERHLEPLDPRVTVEVEGRGVRLRAWLYRVRGAVGAEVPIFLLDTDLPENDPGDRRLTDTLYGGDDRYRLCQELVLGMGGVRMLRALGHERIDRFHLNEGHAALAVLALLEERLRESLPEPAAVEEHVEAIRSHCVFTTHTPVPAGHDKFPHELAGRILGERRLQLLASLDGGPLLNMTELALRASHFVNGVAMRHGEVSRNMFPDYPIRSITNGIHPATWASAPFRALFDRHVRDWRRDALALRYAVGIPLREIDWAHTRAKEALLERVNRDTQADLQPEVLTLGFARRATAYKRPALLLRDPARLAAIAQEHGPIQIVYAGKAHPHDAEGKEMIQAILAAREALGEAVSLVYLPDYDMSLGKLVCAGCDVWLNTPMAGLEASGTSGMKAALNGVPSLSVLDGWWVEGCVEGVTGWAIGDDAFHERLAPTTQDEVHADALYGKLESAVLPVFYGDRERFLGMMRASIALNASFFNTHRMMLQYLYEAYQRPAAPGGGRP